MSETWPTLPAERRQPVARPVPGKQVRGHQPCCSLPVVRIANYDYASEIKSLDVHFAPLEKLKSTLPYPHRHDFYHFVWVTSGAGRHVIDSQSYEVRPNTVFFMTPGQVHDFVLSDDATGHTFSFSRDFFALGSENKPGLAEAPAGVLERLASVVYLNDSQARDLRPIVEAIIEEYTAEQTSYHDVVRCYLRILLIRIARAGPDKGSAAPSSRQSILARRFKNLLEQDFGTVNEAAGYARLLNVSERVLNDAARHAFGATAAQLLRERVMLEAKRLLAHSDSSVAEIADRLGFDDPAYFSRCFRKHTRRSPVEFRRMQALGL